MSFKDKLTVIKDIGTKKRYIIRYGHAPVITPGAPPGTLEPATGAIAPTIKVLSYGPESIEEKVVDDPEDVKEWFERRPVLWVHVSGLGSMDALIELAAIFNLHSLAMEDVVSLGHRPKVEDYGNTLFIVLQMAVKQERLKTEQLALFLGRGFVISFQEHAEDYFQVIRDRIYRQKGKIRQKGPDYLAYAILDTVIDNYYPLLEQYGESLEDIEDSFFESFDDSLMSQVHGIKRDLLSLRRALWPLREVAHNLLTDEKELMSHETRPFLRDCYDHVIQAMDLVETYREIGSSLSDMYLSSLSNRMNQVMKVLTIIATIFIPLSFITGLYGMNFNSTKSPWNMPELDWYWGYPFVLLVMAGVTLTMLLYFFKKKWL